MFRGLVEERVLTHETQELLVGKMLKIWVI